MRNILLQWIKKTGDRLHALRYDLGWRKKRPIVIVGCGHSGTSVLLAILGAHSKIHAIPLETSFAASKTDSRSDPEIVTALDLRFGEMTLKARKLRWVEKTPSHILHLHRVFALYPESRVLLIIRDGRDVACSIQDRTGSLEEGIERWINDNRAGQSFWKDPRVMTLKYEEMVQDRESMLRRVMIFLGEEFEEQMLNHHEKPQLFYADKIEKPESAYGENHEKYRTWQINQPFFDGRGKWRRLTQAELNLIQERAGEMLVEYGYPPEHIPERG